MPARRDLLWLIATETRTERRARIKAEVAAMSAKLPPEVHAAREAAWKALTPEQQAEKHRENVIWFLGRLQHHADRALAQFGGQDRPLYNGGPGHEREVIQDSAIGFYRRIKERTVEMRARVLKGEPPLS